MCGLSGIIVKNKIKDLSLKDKLTKMTKIISHRGPDQAGFIEFENNKGIRTKVKPSLQGDFKATKDAESFTITKENDQWIFHYKTAMDEWQETLLHLDEDEFQVQNDREIIYTYQRFNGYLDGTK